MRFTFRCAFTLPLFVVGCMLVGCGGEEPAPQAPPTPPPASAAASAAVSPAPTETAAPAPPKPSQAELIQQTLKSFGDGMNAHDAAKVASCVASDAVWSAYGMPDTQGRDAIQKECQAWSDMSSDMQGAPKRVFMKGNVVAVEVVFKGTMTGDFMGMKATKKPFGAVDFLVMTFNDDGLISSIHDYVDGPGFMAQLQGSKDAPPLAALPAGPPEMHVAKGTPDEDKLSEWAKGPVLDAFGKNDLKTLSPLFAPGGDVTFYFLGGKVLKNGKDLDKFHADMFKAVPQEKWAVTSAWGVDGYLIDERTLSGTLKGRLGPVPANNKDFTCHTAEVVQPTADGKYNHAWVYGNLAEIAPPPPPKAASPAATKSTAPATKAATPSAKTVPAAAPAAKPAK